MLRKFVPMFAALVVGGLVQSASADVLWSSRPTGGPNDNYNITANPGVLGGGFLEDGTFATSGAHSIQSVNIGFHNNSTSAASFDVLVDFWDSVNYDALPATSVVSGHIGPTYRFQVTNTPAGNDNTGPISYSETGLMTLTGGPIVIPDNNFGMSIRFVNTGADATTGATNISIEPIFHGRYDAFENPNDPGFPVSPILPSVFVGSSDERFGADSDDDRIFNANTSIGNVVVAGDIYTFGSGIDAANLYFELQGTTVPEPASLSLLAIGGLAALRRRRVIA